MNISCMNQADEEFKFSFGVAGSKMRSSTIKGNNTNPKIRVYDVEGDLGMRSPTSNIHMTLNQNIRGNEKIGFPKLDPLITHERAKTDLQHMSE